MTCLLLFFSLHVFLAVYLYGTNCEQFRGLLVQGQENVTDAPLGVFSDFTPNTRESNCTDPGPPQVYNHGKTKTKPNKTDLVYRQQIGMQEV